MNSFLFFVSLIDYYKLDSFTGATISCVALLQNDSLLTPAEKDI